MLSDSEESAAGTTTMETGPDTPPKNMIEAQSTPDSAPPTALKLPDLDAAPLPDFEHPPVAETAIGIEFEQQRQWTDAYFGLFWSSVRKNYPKSRSQLVPPTIPPGTTAPSILPMGPRVRYQFLDESEHHLIQIQTDKLFLNWQRVSSERVDPDQYPRYECLKPDFVSALGHLQRFLDREPLLDPLDVTACEVTYVNHIDRGEGWDTLSDISSLIRNWEPPAQDSVLAAPAGVSFSGVYQAGEGRALQIILQTAVRNKDLKEIVLLTVSGRVRPATSNNPDVLDALDTAHKLAVLGFYQFTDPDVQTRVWKRKERK
jgi:uncharacterized protein (TIGR04255 family)